MSFIHSTRLTLLVAFVGLVFAGHAANAESIRSVQVEGNQRIETATVLSYLRLKAGDELSVDSLDQALKDLFATELFADVQIAESNGTVRVHVVENPIISEIAFEGNEELKDERLLPEISLRPRMVFTRTKVQNDVTRLYDLYRQNGRFSAVIEPKIIKLDQNRVNLVFEITEGGVTEIRSIRFVGNKRYSDDALREVLASKESRWYRFLSYSDRFDQERLNYDQELLRRYYLSQGYADFRVLSAVAELSDNRDDFFLTITVEEGDRYKVGAVDISSSLRDYDAGNLNKELTFAAGDWYNANKVEKSIDAMTKKLGEEQHNFVSIVPDVTRNTENHTIDIAFRINETAKTFVERIDIHGNLRTIDKVIRREMEMVEGDPLVKSKLAKSETNLRDIDYFESVKVQALPGSAPDKQVLDISVAEKSTGELSIGAGFSTSDGPLADFRIRERNFLGKGQEVSLATVIAGKRSEFDVSITEPYFMDRDISAKVDAFHMTRDLQEESSFDQRRTGTGFSFNYPLSENWRQGIGYRIENNEIKDVKPSASRYVRDQEGKRVTSAVTHQIVYNDLDSSLYPTEGMRFWFENDIAGLGGDAKYLGTKTGATYYYPVADNWIFNILGEVGAIHAISDGNIQINERYYIGGSTLRGFSRSGIGPRDLNTDDALGGNYYYRGSAEMSFPVGLPDDYGVAGHLFNDIGSLWHPDDIDDPNVADSDSLRAALGLGLSWRSPMGPVRVDFAFPYLKEDYDDKERFRFSFGTRF